MALFIKKYQFNNEMNENANGRIYGRAVAIGEVDIEELAGEIQENCTVKRSDILAVLSELGPTIKKMMQKSYKVRIPYLGTFKLAVNSYGVDKWDEYDVKKHIKAVKVMFRPEYTIEQRHAVKELTRGLKLAELPKRVTYPGDELAELDDYTSGSDRTDTVDDRP